MLSLAERQIQKQQFFTILPLFCAPVLFTTATPFSMAISSFLLASLYISSRLSFSALTSKFHASFTGAQPLG
jgi:uncharacterized MAPEG superfamily protein